MDFCFVFIILTILFGTVIAFNWNTLVVDNLNNYWNKSTPTPAYSYPTTPYPTTRYPTTPYSTTPYPTTIQP